MQDFQIYYTNKRQVTIGFFWQRIIKSQVSFALTLAHGGGARITITGTNGTLCAVSRACICSDDVFLRSSPTDHFLASSEINACFSALGASPGADRGSGANSSFRPAASFKHITSSQKEPMAIYALSFPTVDKMRVRSETLPA